MLVDGKPSWGTPNRPAIIVQGHVGGEWMEEGEGREVGDDKGQGLGREWMEDTTVTTTLTTTSDSNGL